MKRIITIILTIIMLLSLASCGTGGNPDPSPAPTSGAPVPTAEPMEEPAEDFSVWNYNDNSGASIWMTADSIYVVTKLGGVSAPKIMFSDREYHDWMALCARPDCMHRDMSCNAYFDGTGSSEMNICGEYIYYFATQIYGIGDYVTDSYPDLWRMRLDGSGHEKLAHFVPERGAEAGGAEGLSLYLFGTYAIVAYSYYKAEDDGEGGTSISLDGSTIPTTEYYAADLREDKPEFKNIYQRDAEHGLLFGRVCAGVGNVIYSLLPDFDKPDENGIATESKLLKTDLDRAEITELCELPVMWENSDAELVGDTLFIADSAAGSLYSVNVSTGEYSVKEGIFPVNVKYIEQVWGEGTRIIPSYTHYIIYGGVVMVEEDRADEEEHVIRFYDMEGSLLAVIEYGEGAEPIQLDYNRFIGDYLFGWLPTAGVRIVTEPTWYLDLNEIGTDNLMWRRWEP